MKKKYTGIIIIMAGIYYLLAEAVTAINFNDTLFNTYIYHTISELGIPNANSPLFYIMNSAFIIIGLTLIYGNYTEFHRYINKNRKTFNTLTLVTSVGVIIVALINGGNPLTSGYHALGAVMAILGGNILLVVISRSMNEFKIYQKITLILGIIGLISFWMMFFNMQNIIMPVFERISVYTLIVWNMMTGYYIINN